METRHETVWSDRWACRELVANDVREAIVVEFLLEEGAN